MSTTKVAESELRVKEPGASFAEFSGWNSGARTVVQNRNPSLSPGPWQTQKYERGKSIAAIR